MMSKPIPLRSSSLSAVDTNTAASDFEVRSTPSHKRSAISNGWSTAVRQIRKSLKPAATRTPNSSQRSIAYVNAGAHYVRQVSGMLKDKVNSLRHSSLTEVAQGTYLATKPHLCDMILLLNFNPVSHFCQLQRISRAW
jgi:hypothetical protein